jgi:1-deoxy-D-xylulose-5-phosphate reductoisomerase
MGTQRVVVLGSTGSIGTQALEVCRWRGYSVVGLAAGRNLELLSAQIAEFTPQAVACHPSLRAPIKERFPWLNIAPLEEVAALPAEVVVAALPGLAGLAGIRRALEAGRRLALANKESLVAAGPLLQALAREHHAQILPVDSEHSALFQSLLGERREDIAELLLTASGGPFWREPADLSQITPEAALRHPRWKMGPKVTIDSATLFNKGLEVLEAVQLFGVQLEQVRVVIHPQSYVHSMVRFRDGSLKAQLGPTDMRLPIQYALTYPERAPTPLVEAPLPEHLDFFPPDVQRFPALGLAYEAGRRGGLAPAALSAADEVAVEAFLAGRIKFTEIPRILKTVLGEVPGLPLSWEHLAEVDRWARERAQNLLPARA